MGGGFIGSDVFDFFPTDTDVGSPSPAALFLEKPRGSTFTAGGKEWKIINTAVGQSQRLVQETGVVRRSEGNFQAPDPMFAEVKDGVLTISALSKRGPARPIGRPVVREELK